MAETPTVARFGQLHLKKQKVLGVMVGNTAKINEMPTVAWFGGVLVLEKTIVAKILKYLKTIENCFAWKEHGGQYGTAGIPDIICCHNGKFYAFEVKVPGNKPTKLQTETINAIKMAGGIAGVVYGVDDVKELMKIEEEKE